MLDSWCIQLTAHIGKLGILPLPESDKDEADDEEEEDEEEEDDEEETGSDDDLHRRSPSPVRRTQAVPEKKHATPAMQAQPPKPVQPANPDDSVTGTRQNFLMLCHH